MNKKSILSLAACAGLLAVPVTSQAVVEFVRVCSLFGAAFHYVPGTDTCINETNGDTRQATEGGVWRSLLPYPEGSWVRAPHQECNGRVVPLGTFSATDFTANTRNRKQTRPIPLALNRNDFISRVIMGGGFYDPRTPNRHAVNSWDGLCVRSVDPNAIETQPGGGTLNPEFGNGMLPIGCISNSRIANMPAFYSISATSAYPSIDSYYLDGGQAAVAGPYTYGSQLVVTTDFGTPSMQQLTYFDARTGMDQPLAGSVSVSVCVQQGQGGGR